MYNVLKQSYVTVREIVTLSLFTIYYKVLSFVGLYMVLVQFCMGDMSYAYGSWCEVNVHSLIFLAQ